MASPGESKVDENEVTSEPHRRNRDDDDQELDLGLPPMRQSSIYSLTLDEIQNTVCEPGKSFGSMNMDEFLGNIWSVEEAGFAAATDSAAPPPANVPNVGTGGGVAGGGPLLHRQCSLSVPAPLCRKTVDEVWAEIHEQEVGRSGGAHHGGGGSAGNAHRQPTFGEMTLEDFLIKAGVVREGLGPVSSDGLGGGQVDNSGYGVNGGGGGAGMEVKMSGRKRAADGTVEKMVERRQRRMIKNRESAARSRERKQAYTVELEAELNQLKEENSRLREEERRAQALRKQMIVECMAEHAHANMEKVLRSLRRCNSGPW